MWGSHRRGCTLCHDILRYFPLSNDLVFLSCCYSLRKKIPIILSRPDRGRDAFASNEFIIRLLERRRTIWEDNDTGEEGFDEEGNDVWLPPTHFVEALDFREKDLALFEYLVSEDIFDPKSLSANDVGVALGCRPSNDETDYYFWLMQSSYKRLVAIGFQFDIKPGTLRSWDGLDDVEVHPGMHIQPDETFDRDTESSGQDRRHEPDFSYDSSDDEEDIRAIIGTVENM